MYRCRLYSKRETDADHRSNNTLRPSYLRARASGSPGEKREAFDAVMSLPSRCLVRRRGGKTAAQRLKAKLKFVGSAARALVSGGLLLPAAPLEPVSHTRADEAKSEADRRRVQLLSARQLARRGHYRKKLQRIVGRDMAETTPRVTDSLERCFTHKSSPIPVVRRLLLLSLWRLPGFTD